MISFDEKRLELRPDAVTEVPESMWASQMTWDVPVAAKLVAWCSWRTSWYSRWCSRHKVYTKCTVQDTATICSRLQRFVVEREG